MRLVDDPCDLTGPARNMCDDSGGGSGSGGGGGGPATDGDLPAGLDPLQTLAREIGRAADWVAHQVADVVADRNAVDLTNAGFLRTYAVVFAASCILVLVVWLAAVAKRAIRGVPVTQAISEAIGLLWLAVAATAFTPLILYTVIGAVSAVTDVLVSGLGNGKPGGLFDSLGSQLKEGKIGGGPLMLALVSLATIALLGALWLLLVMRALGIYVGAILGIAVYAGLVDKDLWGRVRRWSGIMLALILIEPVVVIVLGLAAAIQASNNVIAGLAVTVLALGAAIYLITQTPGAGDAIRAARATGRTAEGAARTVLGGGGAAAGVMHGIHTHSTRRGASAPDTSGPSGGQGGNNSAGGVSGGVAAHSRRTPRPRQGDSSSNKPPKKTD
ncbi:hypothetical protein [Streptomyces cacaoi]|uniref:hypothetical protein n=1 Tax=Streptomyces cacaoi TaxID=1898 RepID=UPI0011F1A321|nr:hypothetical protein [Streptomyces cacaoi]